MRSGLIVIAILAASSTSAVADCTDADLIPGCIPNWDGPGAREWQGMVDGARNAGAQINPMDAVKVGFPTAQIMLDAVARSGVPYLNSAAQNVAAIGTKLDKETQTAISNAFKNPSKAIQDAAQTAVKTANDTVDAVAATGRYAERTISGNAQIFTEAQVRLREGKVVDAVWHLGADRVRLQNNNAAQLMQESEVARGVAQSAAATAGGPAGAAAFAAWYTYNASKGDVEKALLSGIYTYAVGTGAAATNAMPTGTVDEVVKKAATVAAVKGLAVAAAGGSQQEIMDAIAQSGSEVIVQSGQAYVTKTYIDPAKEKAKAEADTYCMAQFDDNCADTMQYADSLRQQAEQYKNIATTKPTLVVTKDGQWAISWNKDTLVNKESKAPGVVLTYIGPGSPYRQQMVRLRDLGNGKTSPTTEGKKETEKTKQTPPPVPRPTYYEITVAPNGPWIDDTRFPLGNSYVNRILFFIDDENVGSTFLHKHMEPITWDLTKGDHIFRYMVRVKTAAGGKIEQDCLTKFTVTGMELFSPQIAFEKVGGGQGRVAKCSLVRQ